MVYKFGSSPLRSLRRRVMNFLNIVNLKLQRHRSVNYENGLTCPCIHGSEEEQSAEKNRL